MNFSSLDRLSRRWLCAGFLLLICQGGWAGLIFNPGFEESGGASGPKGWLNGAADGNAAGLYVQDGREGDTVKGGKCSLKFAAGPGGEKCIWIMAPSDLVEVEAGKKYRLSYWIKRVNFDVPGVRFMSECKGFSGDRKSETMALIGKVPGLSGSADWERIEVEVEVPADGSVAKVQLVFRLVGGGRTGIPADVEVYVDDLNLIPAD